MRTGDWKRPDETWDEYCARVDREIRAAGEQRNRGVGMAICAVSALAVILFILWVANLS